MSHEGFLGFFVGFVIAFRALAASNLALNQRFMFGHGVQGS